MPKKTSYSKTSKKSSPKASSAKTKYEVASEIGVDLKKGYNGDLTTKQAGYIGGKTNKKSASSKSSK